VVIDADDHELAILLVQLDLGFRILQVEARQHFLERLLYGVADLGHINNGYDIKTVIWHDGSIIRRAGRLAGRNSGGSMKSRIVALTIAVFGIAIALATPRVNAQKKHENAILDLWAQGKPAFGVYVPSVGQPLPNAPLPPPNANRGGGRGQPGTAPAAAGGQRGPAQARPDPVYSKEIGEALAKDPLVDFAFLNLEGGYDASAVKAIADGLRSPAATHRVTLVVRIPRFKMQGPTKPGSA
jgi:hypothetical protein